MLSTHSFRWKDQDFEIRVTREGGRTTAAAFQNGEPALPFTCSVDFETSARFKARHGLDPVYDPVEGLVKCIQDGIETYYP